MKLRLKNEDELDRYIICHKCHTLNEEMPIADGSKALCSNCGMVLYKRDSRLLDHGLALSLTGLIFFALANLFPLVKINILGTEQYITIVSMIYSLADNGYYLVALFVLYTIFVFPLMIFLLYALIFSLMKVKKGEILTARLLVLLAQIQPWHMSDIFLISILVALVKLFGLAQIHLGISFWTLIMFVLIDTYITRNIHLGELWVLRKKIYSEKRGDISYALC